MKSASRIEFGDFQTPPALAREVCELIRGQGCNPDLVIEPTCGLGAFLAAAAEIFPRASLRGFDLNEEYVQRARVHLGELGATGRSTLRQADFFSHDWASELHSPGLRILILGNPPWVTNAGVAVLNGANLPTKSNLHGLRGIAARTGKSNFDISEWMLMELLRVTKGRAGTVAMLCKTATARKVLRFAWLNDGRIHDAAIYRIDALRYFGAAVDACLLVMNTGRTGPSEAVVFPSLEASDETVTLGLSGKDLVPDIKRYRRWRHLEGLCPFQWRSGVKHDCASVMELKPGAENVWCNKLGESVILEPDYLFPLLKCSDLANGRLEPTRRVVVTQRQIGDDTGVIAHAAPKTWKYLNSHREQFEARRSSIYQDAVPFSLFGVGEYSFAAWKVAVSGLHHSARFQCVGPADGRPVLFDDTCYFLPFDSETEARLVVQLLNSDVCQEFLRSIMFPEAKRPVTVELLRRLNLHQLAEENGRGAEWRGIRSRSTRLGGDMEYSGTGSLF